ncbi:MAG: hypothetical protein R3B45_04680 [Bdellovibrionota bacterium]
MNKSYLMTQLNAFTRLQTPKLKMVYALLVCCFSSISCSSGSDVSLNKSVLEDSDYSPIYEKSTHSQEIYKDFESKYRITVTYLSPNFRNAFAKRLKEIFTQEHPTLDEAINKTGFFISIQSPDDKAINLSDTHLWTIFLENQGTRYSPVLVRRIHDKLRWQPFFKDITKWSKEYLILFDLPSITPNDSGMVKVQNLQLTMANADAQVRLNW